MTMIKLVSSLRSDRTASAAVEFALIGPAFITMFMGVMQVGIGMQNYNALRSISADTARYAAVEYQKSTQITAINIQTYANTVATAPPYGLNSTRFTSFASTPIAQRVSGATEFQLRLTYTIPTFLGVIGLDEIPLTYTRPIFVLPV